MNIFDSWNTKKKKIHQTNPYPYFSIGQIWWCQLGQNISTEAIGKGDDFLRPVVIIQKLYGNAALAIPLTSSTRVGDYYFSFHDSKGTRQCALLAQMRYLNGKRFKYQLSCIKKEDLVNLREAFCSLVKK